MKRIKITVYVRASELDEFTKWFSELINAETYYREQGGFNRRGVELFTQEMMGNFVELQLNLKDYNFWIESTKNN